MPNYNYNLNCTPPGSWTRIFRTAVAGEIAAGGLSRMTSILRHTVDGCEMLHELIGNYWYKTLQRMGLYRDKPSTNW